MGNLVYSSGIGSVCPKCENPAQQCICRKIAALQTLGDGIVRIGRSTNGRKGKGVSVITGLPCTAIELASVAKRLKQKCGTGGTVKEGTIEIQGDHRDLLVKELAALGYRARKSGGS